ncbi:methyltransferase domain-containing protein [Aestuariispira ectoiniformans]|uniref:methyltransferase domain-containing protein n=1 Tax=Aestuariispira ectoiniformans TaxID=2775080 RepID=UPI00223C0CDE|nr:methyltransferase domain-containing protein [Aestuariispira ectoiniformans]
MAPKSPKDKPKIPFRLRFKAWWEGVDAESYLKLERDDPDHSDSNAIHVDDVEEEDTNWPESRVSFLTRLWGGEDQEEVVHPGGTEYTMMLAKPLGLNETKTVLDLCAGLGGGTRELSKQFNLWIEGMEADPELANLANDLSIKHGMEKRAPIQTFDPNKLELPEKRYDAIMIRESMFAYPSRGSLIEKAFNSLKPRGHLLITDYVLKQPDSIDARPVAIWQENHPTKPLPWTMAEYKRAVLNLSMNLHIHEDRTDEYRTLVLNGWSTYVNQLQKSDLDRDTVNELMHEAQYWLRLVRALESGELRYMRIHATRGSETI